MKTIDYEFHKCKESEGKMILINIDLSGNTKCSYCNEIINYGLKEKQ